MSADRALELLGLMALPLETLLPHPENYLLPVDSLFAAYPALTAPVPAEKAVRNGSGFSVSAGDGTYRVYAENGGFLLLGRVENGTARTIKSFFEV